MDQKIDRIFRVTSFRIRLTCRNTREDLNPLIDGFHRIDMKQTVGNSLHNIFAQHEILDITLGQEDSLCTRQLTGLAAIEESFYFLIRSPDRLHFALLVDGTSNSQVLPQRQTGKAGQNGVNLCGRCAVSIHPRIRLFEGDARSHGQGFFLCVFLAQITTQNENPFIVSASGHVRFSFNIDDPARPMDVEAVIRVGLPKL